LQRAFDRVTTSKCCETKQHEISMNKVVLSSASHAAVLIYAMALGIVDQHAVYTGGNTNVQGNQVQVILPYTAGNPDAVSHKGTKECVYDTQMPSPGCRGSRLVRGALLLAGLETPPGGGAGRACFSRWMPLVSSLGAAGLGGFLLRTPGLLVLAWLSSLLLPLLALLVDEPLARPPAPFG
jgi:hypothetical protein